MTDLWLIDAFADAPFTGNPAAVCWLDREVPDQWMQSLAMEMNQAETAFLRTEGEGFRLRWFTPAAEVNLCGHATLASAHFLWTTGRLPNSQSAHFDTRSGRLIATQSPAGAIVLDFPATPARSTPAPDGLFEALGIESGEAATNGLAQPDILIRVEDPAVVRSLKPALGALMGIDVRGVIVTAAGDRPGIDFVSRFFAPGVGVDEDPVTGSAHCTLAPFWGSRLGKTEMVGYQASRRGGTVGVKLVADRVHLSGRALTVIRGEVELPA